jgi:hypothetical protein
MERLRLRFWIEAGAAVASAVLAVLTLFVRDWIEITGFDPDRHSGAAEWWVVGFLAVLAAGSAIAARLELRHASATSSS